MLSLHTPRSVFSLRHAPSWLLLACSAGSVNAIAFMACSRFVTHVTGTVSRIGIDSGTIALDYALVLGCFILGAMSSATLIEVRYHRRQQPLYAMPLAMVAAILALLALTGSAGLFGKFGGSVEDPHDFVFLAIVAFAMGLQNAAVATSTGMLVRTTHMTGPATDLGVHLATALHSKGEPRRVALQNAALRAGKITAFTVGAAAGAALAGTFGYGALLAPALVIAAATALSFVRVPSLQPGELAR